MMSEHDGTRAGMWNYWKEASLKYGWAGWALAEGRLRIQNIS